ncbi:MAG: phytanoyl-CoA dioxygenase family protein [Gammaproteobacteria bacterium]|jgi:phytanoyl-CoA hydroxylase
MRPNPNREPFVWQDPPGPFELLSQAQVAAYMERGGFVLHDAFTPEEIERVVAAIDPIEAETESLLEQMEHARLSIARAGEIVFAPHLVTRSEVLRAFSMHPLICRLVTELIGPDVRLYWDQLVYKKPHTAAEFPWHQDNGYTFVLPQQYLTCWVALTDATIENGCPWIVPGAHRQGTLDHRWTDLGFECLSNPDRAVALPVGAGSVAVFSSLTPHRTGPNITDGVRKAYILQYAPDGAVMYPRGGGSVAADNPDWQYPVTIGGQAVA